MHLLRSLTDINVTAVNPAARYCLMTFVIEVGEHFTQ